MSKITSLNIPAVNTIASDLDAAVAQFAAALAEMKRIAAELHGCWGDDEAGRNFAESYLQNAEDTLSNGTITVETVTELAGSLRKIAQMFSELDSESGGVLTLVDK